MKLKAERGAIGWENGVGGPELALNQHASSNKIRREGKVLNSIMSFEKLEFNRFRNFETPNLNFVSCSNRLLLIVLQRSVSFK